MKRFLVIFPLILLLGTASLLYAGRSFNGSSDAISAPGVSTPIDITTGAMSFMCWFKMTSTPSNEASPCSKWSAANTGGYMLTYNCSGCSGSSLNAITGEIYISISLNHYHAESCSATINLNQWYVAVLAYQNNNTLKVYLGTNGTMTLCGSDNGVGSTGAMVSSGNNLIWASPRGACGGSCSYFTGLVAETAVWNVYLSPAQIANLATVCPVGPSARRMSLPVPVGYWPMWGASGASIEPDLSGNGNAQSGTLTGTAKANHPPCTP